MADIGWAIPRAFTGEAEQGAGQRKKNSANSSIKWNYIKFRENLASKLAEARRWSGCCTTGSLEVTICLV